MEKKENVILGLIYIVVGVLMIIMKGGVINAAITVVGVAVIISAIFDFSNRMTNTGIVKAVIGVCVLVFGWLLVNIAFYILAACIIIMGLFQIVNINRYGPVNLTGGQKFLTYIRPVLTVIAGACLLFNQAGTINWIFVVTGVLLIVEGFLELINPNGE